MPNFDKNTGFSMNIGGNSKVNDGSFNEKQTGLLKTAPMYKSLVGDQDKLPTDLKDAIRASPVRKNGDKGIGMAGDSDEDKISTEKLDNVTMYGRDKSKPKIYPSEVGGTDSVNSPSGGATFTSQTGNPVERMKTADILKARESKKLKS
mgnify:FL=1|tara:strand:- start:341 stop:787 length:447 start_codon:yes stop_codon:yes gene_type:complete